MLKKDTSIDFRDTNKIKDKDKIKDNEGMVRNLKVSHQQCNVNTFVRLEMDITKVHFLI